MSSLLIGGVVADRMSRQTVMVTADLARVVTQGVLAALVITGDPALWLAAGLLLAVVVAPLAVREVRTMPGD